MRPGDPGAPEAAARAREHAAAGDQFYDRGLYRPALSRFRDAARLRPADWIYHFKAACAAWWADEPDLSERHAQEAVRVAPRSPEVHEALAQWYLDRDDVPRALRHSAAAFDLAPNEPAVRLARASALSAAGEAPAAWELIGPLVDAHGAGPLDARLAVAYARVAPKVGRGDQAAAALGRALQAPGLPAWAGRQLHFAAAALLDRLGRYDEAFDHARRGQELARAEAPRPHDAAAHSAWIDNRIRYFTRERLQALPRATHGNRRPVFIVGMPRSGTSLVEQILASHPQVFGGGELTALGRIGAALERPDWAEGQSYPQCLDWLSLAHANRLASPYLSHLESLDREATYVTDKMPLNCLGLELAELLLPGCHVIHCVRDPLDACLSCYLTDFADGAHEFRHRLGDLGAFYRDYRRLMEHWKAVLTVPIFEVRYEDLVFDTERNVRRLLDFLGLPWDERCMKFHETQRAVVTASKEQVRRPMYTSSVGRWKHYQKHLGELIAALGRPSSGDDPAAPADDGTFRAA